MCTVQWYTGALCVQSASVIYWHLPRNSRCKYFSSCSSGDLPASSVVSTLVLALFDLPGSTMAFTLVLMAHNSVFEHWQWSTWTAAGLISSILRALHSAVVTSQSLKILNFIFYTWTLSVFEVGATKQYKLWVIQAALIINWIFPNICNIFCNIASFLVGNSIPLVF